MIVDASAIVAVVAREPSFKGLVARLEEEATRLTHPVSVYEAALAVARIRNVAAETAMADVQDFLIKAEIGVVPLDTATASAALRAFARYGKGRHPAGLNMGDCFSYGCARIRGMTLLYRGEDFAKTDLA